VFNIKTHIATFFRVSLNLLSTTNILSTGIYNSKIH
jgi:flagellar biosynthesis component FlhA